MGIDLGQAADYTAIVVDEIVELIDPAVPKTRLVGVGPFAVEQPIAYPRDFEHRFRHIQRFPLKQPYPQIVAGVGELVEKLKPQGRVLLVFDQTGVGRPVVDMFRQARYGVQYVGVTITSGSQAAQDPDASWMWTVPKKDLVGALQTQFHRERVKIARGLPEAKTLLTELQNFRMKITAAANVTYEAWRDGDKDDLVLAAALAVWGGMRATRGGGLA